MAIEQPARLFKLAGAAARASAARPPSRACSGGTLCCAGPPSRPRRRRASRSSPSCEGRPRLPSRATAWRRSQAPRVGRARSASGVRAAPAPVAASEQQIANPFGVGIFESSPAPAADGQQRQPIRRREAEPRALAAGRAPGGHAEQVAAQPLAAAPQGGTLCSRAIVPGLVAALRAARHGAARRNRPLRAQGRRPRASSLHTVSREFSLVAPRWANGSRRSTPRAPRRPLRRRSTESDESPAAGRSRRPAPPPEEVVPWDPRGIGGRSRAWRRDRARARGGVRGGTRARCRGGARDGRPARGTLAATLRAAAAPRLVFVPASRPLLPRRRRARRARLAAALLLGPRLPRPARTMRGGGRRALTLLR